MHSRFFFFFLLVIVFVLPLAFIIGNHRHWEQKGCSLLIKMPTNWIEFLLLADLALLSSCSAVKVEYDATAIIIDGQRKIINAGAIHYTRSTEQV